jgi:Holliday junction resolvase
MAMTPEKKVKQRVVAQLKELGAYYFYPATGGYGSSGLPDVVCCLDGRFIGIECKAGKGKTTALQDKNLREIEAAGGVALVINEDNVDNLTGIIRQWLDILELSRNKRTRTTD